MQTWAMTRRGCESADTTRGPARWLAALVALAAAALIVGCGSYELRGRAIEGPSSGVHVVDRDDPRLEAPGLSGAAVSLTLDPDRLSAERVGEVATDVDGDFAIAVDAFGAGMLEYQAQVDGQLAGHEPAIGRFDLPGRGKRVLVVLAPGDDDAATGGESFLDETLRMGEPYME